MTPRQHETMVFIQSFKATERRWPTYREIAAGLGMKSTGGAHHAVDRLVERGHLTKGLHKFTILRPVAICLSCCSGCHALFEPRKMRWFHDENIQLCPGCVELREAA